MVDIPNYLMGVINQLITGGAPPCGDVDGDIVAYMYSVCNVSSLVDISQIAGSPPKPHHAGGLAIYHHLCAIPILTCWPRVTHYPQDTSMQASRFTEKNMPNTAHIYLQAIIAHTVS